MLHCDYRSQIHSSLLQNGLQLAECKCNVKYLVKHQS